MVTEQFAPEDEVRIIVELEDAPLLDEQVAMRAYSSAGDYLNSDEAQSHEAALTSARKRVTRAMNTSDMDITVEREYSRSSMACLSLRRRAIWRQFRRWTA